MTVNPPEPHNFPKEIKSETIETTVRDHPNTVYLDDVQAVQLEVYRARTENRKPNFKEFSERAVRAAGFDKKGHDINSEQDYVENVLQQAEQTPIMLANGEQVNERNEPKMPVDDDPTLVPSPQDINPQEPETKPEFKNEKPEPAPTKKAAAPSRAAKAAAARKKP